MSSISSRPVTASALMVFGRKICEAVQQALSCSTYEWSFCWAVLRHQH
jgi:hypothetical protein